VRCSPHLNGGGAEIYKTRNRHRVRPGEVVSDVPADGRDIRSQTKEGIGGRVGGFQRKSEAGEAGTEREPCTKQEVQGGEGEHHLKGEVLRDEVVSVGAGSEGNNGGAEGRAEHCV